MGPLSFAPEHAMTAVPAKPVFLTGASGALGRVLAKEGWTQVVTDIAPQRDVGPERARHDSAR